MNLYQNGWNDAQAGQFFAYSLLPGKSSNSEGRVTYRAGWIANRAARGLETLPACIAEFHLGANRHYWIVAIERERPIYNVTNGAMPINEAGYFDLPWLMKTKGDSYE